MAIKYDAKAINHDVRIEDVLQYYGFSSNMRGKFRCPSVDHNDKNPSASVSPRGNFCKCFSCNRNFNPISLVMNRENYTFPEACEFIIQNFGLERSYYCEEEDRYNKAIPLKEKFPLTMAELNVLGWEMGSKYMELQDDEGHVYEIRNDCPTLKDYYKENPEDFYATLCEKIETAAFFYMKKKMFLNDNIVKDVKNLVQTHGSFDECRRVLNAYVCAKQHEFSFNYSQQESDIIMEMLFLRDWTKDAKKVEKEAGILFSIANNLPKIYQTESLMELVEGVNEMSIYIPEVLNEELEDYMSEVDKEYER